MKKHMKRFMLAALMALSVIFIASCGSKDKPENTNTPAADTDRPESGVSSEAVSATDRPEISADEAFTMAEDMLKKMTLEEKVGQLFVVHLSQLDEARSTDGNVYHLTDDVKKTLSEYHIGGIYLTQNNVKKPDQTKLLTEQIQSCISGPGLYVAVEEEGAGPCSLAEKVPGLIKTERAAQSEMAENMTEEQVYETGASLASELADIGVNLNLAPVADVATADNPLYAQRCFGEDADKASGYLANIVKGMRDGGVAVTLKYFPGLGSVQGQYTEEILDNQSSLMTLRGDTFSLYEAGINAGADCVMVGSASVSKVTVKKLAAFLSRDVVTTLLREELDFEGVIMTPPLDDNVIVNNYTPGFVAAEAVKAGCDVLLCPKDFRTSYQALLDNVKKGEINEKVINTAARRILQNKIRRGIVVPNNKQQ